MANLCFDSDSELHYDVELTTLNWSSLETAFALTLTKDQRRRLLASLNRYLSKAVPEDPSIKASREYALSIQKHADALAAILRGSRQDQKELLVRDAVVHNVFGSLDVDPIDLAANLTEVSSNCTELLNRPGAPTRGRPGNDALPVMIRDWHAIYHEAGGTGKGYTRSGSSRQADGPFLRLIHDAFKQAEGAATKGYIPLALQISIKTAVSRKTSISQQRYALAQMLDKALES